MKGPCFNIEEKQPRTIFQSNALHLISKWKLADVLMLDWEKHIYTVRFKAYNYHLMSAATGWENTFPWFSPSVNWQRSNYLRLRFHSAMGWAGFKLTTSWLRNERFTTDVLQWLLSIKGGRITANCWKFLDPITHKITIWSVIN